MGKSGDAAENRTTLPEASIGLGRAELENAVLSQQILVLYESHWISFFNVANAALTAFVLRDLLPTRMFIGWIALFCIVILARSLNHTRYLRKAPQMEMAAIWGWRYAAGTTATGCLWGLTAAGILITPNPADHTFIAFVVSGMMAGAVAGDSAFLPALIGFAVPAALPITFAFFARGDPTSTIMGSLVASFTIVLGLVGFRSNRWIASIARREIIQRGLAADLVRRITERQAAERDLQQSNKILQAVAESTTTVLRSVDFDQSSPKVLELIGGSLGVNCAHLYANNGAANVLFVRQMWNAAGGAPIAETRGLWQSAGPDGSILDFLAQGKAQFIRTSEVDDTDRSFLETCGVQSFLLVPVFTGGIWWGALGVGDAEANRSWLRVEIDALRTVAGIVGSAIAHTRDLTEIADAGRIVESGSTMLYRLRPKVPYAVEYVSRNIERYGYTQSQFLSGPESFMEAPSG
jgi:PAS domain-containing protein